MSTDSPTLKLNPPSRNFLSIFIESVKSFSQDNNISDSERASVMAVLKYVLIILILLNVLSSCATLTVTGAVISSRNAMFVSGNADLQTSENLVASARAPNLAPIEIMAII